MRAFRATSATPAAEGCTIAHVLLPKIAWYWFSPALREALDAALLEALELGRAEVPAARALQRLPASVAVFRICGVAASRHASASAGNSA